MRLLLLLQMLFRYREYLGFPIPAKEEVYTYV
jgi:hypothetical protein